MAEAAADAAAPGREAPVKPAPRTAKMAEAEAARAREVEGFQLAARASFQDLQKIVENLAPVSGVRLGSAEANQWIEMLTDLPVSRDTLVESGAPVVIQTYQEHPDKFTKAATKILLSAWRALYRQQTHSCANDYLKSAREDSLHDL